MEIKTIRKSKSDTAVLFVHGINSSAEECWKHSDGAYWPDLLSSEEQFDEALGIYVYTYKTSWDSGSYSIGDVVDDLKERIFTLNDLDNSKKIIFVCHSMGGIVVRRLIVDRSLDFIDNDMKLLGLYLVASPSLGSGYANWLGGVLAQLVGQAQAKVLKFSTSNPWLNDLDKSFFNILSGENVKIYGKELIEDKPTPLLRENIFSRVLLHIFQFKIVQPYSAHRYFGDPLKVPNSDHFSIAKPKDKSAIQNKLLVNFILTKFPACKAKRIEAQEEAPQPKLEPNTDADKKLIGMVRNKIGELLGEKTQPASLLCEALINDEEVGIRPEETLLPPDAFASYDRAKSAVVKLLKAVKNCKSSEHLPEIKDISFSIMGWLVLLPTKFKGDIASLDLDRTGEVVISISAKTSVGTEACLARFDTRPAKFKEGSAPDRAIGAGFPDIGEIELGLLSDDRSLRIEKLIYQQVFYGCEPNLKEDWLKRLRETLSINAELNKLYPIVLSEKIHSDYAHIVKQLKIDLPHVRVCVMSKTNEGDNSILIVNDEDSLETLVILFLNRMKELN